MPCTTNLTQAQLQGAATWWI